MDRREQESFRYIDVEDFRQNGNAGCQTACLANIARHLLGENITPTDVDRELGRGAEDDITYYTRDFWMLERGLKLEIVTGYDPVGFVDYLDEKFDFEQLLLNIANHRFGGSLAAARSYFDCDEYRGFIEAQKRQRIENAAAKAEYIARGQLVETEGQPTFSDIKRSVKSGSMALCQTLPINGASHQVVCFSPADTQRYWNSPVSDEAVFAYYPLMQEGVKGIAPISDETVSFDYRQMVIVSRFEQ